MSIRFSFPPLILSVSVTAMLLYAQAAFAAPVALPQPAAEIHQDRTIGRQVAGVQAGSTVPPVDTVAPTTRHLKAGFPTTREKWRYCPLDGSHPCVDLDIPGVTIPDQQSTQ